MKSMVDHLQDEYSKRMKINERYSLRAFARSLKVPPSSLSEILNEKRPITKKLALKLGNALNLSEDHINAFSSSNQDEVQYKQLALDSFYIIAEWYHYGILQLIKTKSFKNDPKWIARRLGVTPQEIATAIDRLKRVGILVEKNGKLSDITNGNTSHLVSNFTSAQLRSFQIEALQKGIEGLKHIPIEYRDNTSMTFAMSKEALPFAKEEIKKFRRKLTKKLEAFGEPDEVYQLALSLTPLTNVPKYGEQNELH